MAYAVSSSPMNSCSRVVERAKPLLGTFVAIRVGGLAPQAANDALARSFAAIADIHRLMSFQEADSDISRLNRDAHRQPVEIHAHTYEVLKRSLEVSAHSEGVFDVTVATHLHSRSHLRLLGCTRNPDPDARWRDIRLGSCSCVRFARPLRIDVSGIAKGYAVDCAMKILKASGASRACVNAGGDLAAFGAQTERVYLQMPMAGETTLPVLELRNECLATSGTRAGAMATHIDGVERRAAPARLVSVVAPSCTIADALTKVVSARGTEARKTLRYFGATALMSTGSTAWSEIS